MILEDEEGSSLILSGDKDNLMDEISDSTSMRDAIFNKKENSNKHITTLYMMMAIMTMVILVLVYTVEKEKSAGSVFLDAAATVTATAYTGTSTYVKGQEETHEEAMSLISDHTSNNKRCMNLDFNQTMDTLISNSKPIFITMPTKAAGTSMALFAGRCVGRYIHDLGNVFDYPKTIRAGLTNSLELPSIVASHSLKDSSITDLIKNSHEKALIIYIHRDETDRIKSAIRHVFRMGKLDCKMNEDETRCVMEEEKLVDAIEEQVAEIKHGSSILLSCDVYDSIVDNAPSNMIFLNYKQVDQLQKLLAKNYCPELLEDEPIKANYRQPEEAGIFVQLPSPPRGAGGNEHDADDDELLIEIDEWLDKKIYYLEWALRMREKATCQSRTKMMEHELFQCPHEAVRVPGVADSMHW